mgnify:FL=1
MSIESASIILATASRQIVAEAAWRWGKDAQVMISHEGASSPVALNVRVVANGRDVDGTVRLGRREHAAADWDAIVRRVDATPDRCGHSEDIARRMEAALR